MNNSIWSCVFIKKSKTKFAIIATYVNDLNLIQTSEELTKTINYLKNEFEMKNLRKTKYCLSLRIEYCSNYVLVYQQTYIKKVLKYFYMDKLHPLNSLIIVCSLEVNKDSFHPKKKEKKREIT